MKKLLLILALAPALLFSQTRKQRKALAARQKADQVIINNFKSHYQNLTNKHLSEDTLLARTYIINQFKAIGLQPKGTDGYIQRFKIDLGKQIKTGTFLKVNGVLLTGREDYFPLSYSAQKSVSGMLAMALRERGVPWFTDLKMWLEDNLQNQTFDINLSVQKEAQRAASKGATALFVYNTSNVTDNIHLDSKDKTTALSIPVIYITRNGYKHYFNDHSQMMDIELNVAFEETIKNADDISGFIDNGAASNIVITAPYNDLFSDENGNMNNGIQTKDSVDVAGGPSILIEVARMLAASNAKNNNYTFVAYRGQSLVSPGGNWLNSQTMIPSVKYIINLGRVQGHDQNQRLLIKSNGAPGNLTEAITSLTNKTAGVSFDSSRAHDTDTLPRKVSVPIINFYTADNNNSNRNSGSEDKVNYEAELQIARLIASLIEATDTKGRFALAEK